MKFPLLMLFLVACGPSPAAPHHTHWGYGADDGPARWASLDSSFAACGAGVEQAPIDIPATIGVGDASALPSLHLGAVPINFVDNGHTIEVRGVAGMFVTVGDARYELAQVHFHVPSEHAIAGKLYDAEVHLVHKTASGKLLVIGVLLTQGTKSDALDPLFAALPARPVGTARTAAGTVDLATLVGPKARFVHYRGSLTTPPCSEGVDWYVVDPSSSASTLSDEQLAKLRQAVHGGNHRPVQPLGARNLVTVGP